MSSLGLYVNMSEHFEDLKQETAERRDQANREFAADFAALPPDAKEAFYFATAGTINQMQSALKTFYRFVPSEHREHVKTAIESLLRQSNDTKRDLVAAVPELRRIFPSAE